MISVEAMVDGKAMDRVVASLTSKIIEKRKEVGELDSFGVRVTSQAIMVVVNPSSLAGDKAFADCIRKLAREAIEEAINS